MNTLTWLDLYNFLYQQANDTKNFGQFDWSSPVIIHDAETGSEYSCDTYFISDKKNVEKATLVINQEHIFS